MRKLSHKVSFPLDRACLNCCHAFTCAASAASPLFFVLAVAFQYVRLRLANRKSRVHQGGFGAGLSIKRLSSHRIRFEDLLQFWGGTFPILSRRAEKLQLLLKLSHFFVPCVGCLWQELGSSWWMWKLNVALANNFLGWTPFCTLDSFYRFVEGRV